MLTLIGITLLLAHLFEWQIQPLVVLLVGLAVALLYAVGRTITKDTSLMRTAKVLEALEPSLHTRLSTALELDAQGRNNTPVRQAQLQDANRHAQKLADARIIRPELPAGLRNALLTGAGVLAVGTLVSGPLAEAVPRATGVTVQTAPEATDPVRDVLSVDEQTALAADIREITVQFQEIIEERDDDAYLEALNREMRQLADLLEGPEEPMREEALNDLNRLLEHLQTALNVEENDDPKLAGIPEQLQNAMSGLGQTDNESPSEANQNDSPQGTADAGGETESVGAGSPNEQDNAPLPTQQADNAPGTEQPPADQPTRSRETFLENVMSDADVAEQNERVMDDTEHAQAGGGGDEQEPPGEQAMEASMRMTGQGTEALFGTEAAAELNAEQLEELELEAETDPDGRRVEVDLTPEAEFTEVRMTPLGEMTWNRQLENEVVREALSSNRRQVSARYHTPEQDEQ